MSEKENKALVNAFVEEVWNRKNLAAVDKYFAPDHIEHDLARPDWTGGREDARQAIADFTSAFPDCHVTYDDVLAEGDRVAVRLSCRATHKGEFMGVGPTGRAVAFGGLSIIRLSSGRIVEIWEIIDSPGLIRQIRAAPPLPEKRE